MFNGHRVSFGQIEKPMEIYGGNDCTTMQMPQNYTFKIIKMVNLCCVYLTTIHKSDKPH